MKIYLVKDKEYPKDFVICYLLYFENDKRFYVEWDDGIDLDILPMPFDALAKKGQKYIDSYWSKIWVQQRIVPSNRQNITQILLNNNMDSYDEFELLIVDKGRCCHDELYLEEVKELPETIKEKFNKHVNIVSLIGDDSLIVIFNDGVIKKYYFNEIINEKDVHNIVNNNLLFYLEEDTGGYGIRWLNNIKVSYDELYEKGTLLPLVKSELECFIKDQIINTKDATEILNCSRQNIDDLVKREKIKPIKEWKKNKIFFKSDLLKRVR